MSTHQIHVFVSHSWTYSGHYDTLYGWIFENNWRFGQASLKFCDYSVPKDDPIHNATNDRDLKAAIDRKIERCHVIVVPTGMYVNYSKWIQKEIERAVEKSKSILSVNPWDQQRKSLIVARAANLNVGWNKNSVVDGIWKLYYITDE